MIFFNILLRFNFGKNFVKSKLANCGENVIIMAGCVLTQLNSINIGNNVSIKPGTEIYACKYLGSEVFIEDNVSIGRNVTILTGDHFYTDTSIPISDQGSYWSPLLIESGAMIGTGSIITASCNRIGRGSMIAAGSVVNRDVPDYCMVAGVPARIRKYFGYEKQICIGPDGDYGEFDMVEVLDEV